MSRSPAHLNYAPGLPRGLRFSVDWANTLEKEMIIQRLRAGGRQTMNVRMMPTAKFIVLRSLDENGKIVGWQGLDYETNPQYPEKFSLHLDEEYRSFLLGLVLEQAFAIHLRSLGLETAFVRMDTAGNGELKEFRVKMGFFQPLEPVNLNPEWVAKCEVCELYKGSCQKPGYFAFRVNELLEFATRRLGPTNFTELPALVSIVKEMVRKDDGEREQFKAKWAA